MAFHISLEEQISKIRTHLANMGKVSTGKVRPRIFVAVHHVNWEKHGLVDGWAEIADVVHYDWGNSFDQYAADWHQRGKPDFNKVLLRQVELAHREKPIDLFFSYLSGRWVYPDTIRAIGKMNIITANISLDDKLKFWGYQEPGGLSGNAEIAPEFDLCITTQAEEDVQKYLSVGARSLFLPPGGNTHSFSPIPAPRDIPVSFVGQCYGSRPHIIAWLKSNGISVQTFGKGWPSGELSHQEMNVIYSRSVVNLGFGFIGDSPLTGLKGRDFEVPLMGGLYLTTYNQDLENCFIPGEEIECYRNETDLLSKLHYYAEHPDIALHIGAAGRNRCLREHTWIHKFKTILSIIGLSNQTSDQNGSCLLNESKKQALDFFNSAEQFAHNNQYKDAIQHYQMAIEADTTFANAYYNLGIVCSNINQTDAAISHFKKVVELEPQSAGAYNNLGVSYFSKGLIEEAESHFRKAISLDTNYTEAVQNLENVHVKQAFSKVEQCGGKLDGWALSKNEIRSFAIHVLKTNPEPTIIELGGGQSTLFWKFLAQTKNTRIKVSTFEHHPNWGKQLRSAVADCTAIEVHCYNLRQISDQEWNTIFTFPEGTKNSWPHMGTLVPQSEFENTRIRNAFYDIPSQAFPPHASIDGMIVDGPHGNGRSLAFPLFFDCLKPDAWMLIDDFDHYPFLDDLAKIFRFKMIDKELANNGKRWVLLRLDGISL